MAKFIRFSIIMGLALLAILTFSVVKHNVISQENTLEEVSPLEVIAPSSPSEVSNSPSTATTLRTLAAEHNIHIGAAVLTEPFSEDSTYREQLARQFNLLVPENAMKFKSLHPEFDRYNFTNADAMVEFAEAHQMEVHAHALLWHQSLPDWLTEGDWSQAELKTILRQHIETVVSHYRGRVLTWDVVNEAVSGKGSLRDSFWLEQLGPDCIEWAFQWAHEADPDAQLFYNDHDGEELGVKSDAIYALVQGLQERNVPIHGVGLQMHKSLGNAPDPEAVAANMQRLADLGLEVQISEMDVSLDEGEGTQAEQLEEQAKVYQTMLQTCLEASNCTAFTTWGLTDQFSWIPQFYDRPDAPLLFDEAYQPKPAYDALIDVLQN